MTLADAAALAMLGALVLYAVLGGADFGGGVWDLLASGPRKAAQRRTIERAIAPVWEANHVWLIVAVVVLFTAFPPAFAALSTALHVPIVILLVGIVLRGAAFVFRQYAPPGDAAAAGWGRVFAVSSTLAPVLLGVILGTISSGELGLDERAVPRGGWFGPWLQPFPWAVGAFALALFAFLAAVYLVVEAEGDPALRDDFRRRALAAAAVVVVTGALAAVLGERRPPLAIALAAALALALAVLLLVRRRSRWARLAAAAVVALVVVGWGLAQRPYLIAPDVTIAGAAAPAGTLRALLGALVAGTVILVPSLYAMLRVFKSRP